MSHLEDNDNVEIVPDEVTENSDTDKEDEVDQEILKQIREPSLPLSSPENPVLETALQQPTEDEDDEDEDFYSGPSKVIRLPLTVEPKGVFLEKRSGSQISAIQKTASMSAVVSSPPSNLSINFISEYFRQLDREICLLSPLHQMLLFIYLIALAYIALL